MYRPLVCLVLQGAKQMIAGREERLFEAGQSIIIGIDLPVIGRIVEASREKPYLAIAVELDAAILHEMAARISDATEPPEPASPLITVRSDESLMNCATGLMHLLDRPDAAPLLQPALLQELHYWLLTSSHGPALRALTKQDSYAQRIAGAIEVIRKNYHKPISVEELASIARISTSAFRRRFKALTSLSPVQFQKHLRLIEARRLMRSEGMTATRAAHHVGYESVSQFTREYARMFGAPPRRDVSAPPSQIPGLVEDETEESTNSDT
jgi:AraC-like DNA-binding protein